MYDVLFEIIAVFIDYGEDNNIPTQFADESERWRTQFGTFIYNLGFCRCSSYLYRLDGRELGMFGQNEDSY